jgi:hypothetical protein
MIVAKINMIFVSNVFKLYSGIASGLDFAERGWGERDGGNLSLCYNYTVAIVFWG